MARSLDSKIDEILEQLKLLAPVPQKLDNLCDTVKSIQDDVNTVKHDVAQHEDKIAKLEEDIKTLKISDNAHKQQLRSLTLRILNLPPTAVEKDDLRGRIYDLLKPLLTAAKSAKDLSTVPQAATAFDAVFRPYQGEQGKNPPPVIIKVSSRAIKIALLKNRKLLAPAPHEAGANSVRPLLVEDLTPENHRALSLLAKSKKVEKVWSADGLIRFTLPGQSRVRTVSNVLGTVDEMIAV